MCFFSKAIKILFFFLLVTTINHAQISICSWNIQNFGKSKTDSDIQFIATTLKDFDLIAIVEVVAGYGGSQAIARLADELNRKGSNWDYSLSEPTSGTPSKSERYAFIWKKNKLNKIGDAWLDKKYSVEIDREPYLAKFKSGTREFTLATFHALPKGKHPEKEINYLQYIIAEHPSQNILFCGDFNCSESNSIFTTLKSKSYNSAFTNQKTSLKMKANISDCLASEYDNFFYNKLKNSMKKSGVIHFYNFFKTLKEARKISDHLPVFLEFSVN